MKIAGKKDLVAEKLRGRADIDLIYVPRINEAMGPKFALYQAKAYAAMTHGLGLRDPLVDEVERGEILFRWDKLLSSIAIIETGRQAAQARIDAATSAAEIDAIVATL